MAGLTGQLVLLDPELGSVRDMLGQGGSTIDHTGRGDPAPYYPIVAHAAAPPRLYSDRVLLLKQLDDFLTAAIYTGWPQWRVRGAAEWLVHIATQWFALSTEEQH